MALKVKSKTLKLMRNETGSQWSRWSTGLDGFLSSQTKQICAVLVFVCKLAATFVNSIDNQKRFLAFV